MQHCTLCEIARKSWKAPSKMPAFLHILLGLLLLLLPQNAEAQHKLDRRGCYGLGETVTISGSGFGRRPSGKIALEVRGRALVLRPLRWSSRRISMKLPGRGPKPGTAYRLNWLRPGATPLTLGTVPICDSNQASGSAAVGAKLKSNRVPNRTRAPRDVVAAPDGSPEYVVVVSGGQANAAANALQGGGAQLLRTRNLPGLGQQMQFYAFPGNLSLNQARTLLQNTAPSAAVDLHHIYRLSAGPRLYHAAMLGDDPGRPCRLPGGVRVGVIDGPLNPAHAALKGVAVKRQSMLTGRERSVSADHGTAVAGLIAGPAAAGPLTGLAPGARIFAVEAFSTTKGGSGARMENVAAGLGWLTAQRVRLVNMSFAGTPNQALGRVIALASGKGVVMVAAAGNDGSASPRYPAAAPEVIAVTAVDAAGRLYGRANTGRHIEFAAPGVDLFVARGSGGGYRSGTSYAAPVVTALLARVAARGGLSASGARRHLRQRARDLGPPGRDTRFGYGLVQSSGC